MIALTQSLFLSSASTLPYPPPRVSLISLPLICETHTHISVRLCHSTLTFLNPFSPPLAHFYQALLPSLCSSRFPYVLSFIYKLALKYPVFHDLSHSILISVYSPHRSPSLFLCSTPHTTPFNVLGSFMPVRQALHRLPHFFKLNNLRELSSVPLKSVQVRMHRHLSLFLSPHLPLFVHLSTSFPCFSLLNSRPCYTLSLVRLELSRSCLNLSELVCHTLASISPESYMTQVICLECLLPPLFDSLPHLFSLFVQFPPLSVPQFFPLGTPLHSLFKDMRPLFHSLQYATSPSSIRFHLPFNFSQSFPLSTTIRQNHPFKYHHYSHYPT